MVCLHVPSILGIKGTVKVIRKKKYSKLPKNISQAHTQKKKKKKKKKTDRTSKLPKIISNKSSIIYKNKHYNYIISIINKVRY